MALSNGATAFLATSMKWKDRKEIIQKVGIVPEAGIIDPQKTVELSELLLKVLIKKWDVKGEDGLTLPIPAEKPEILDDLDARDFDALFEVANHVMENMNPPKTSTDTSSS